MKDQVSQMQQKMQEEHQRQQFERNGYVKANASKPAPAKAPDQDYIDYEEVKDRD